MIEKALIRELVDSCRGDAKKVMMNGRWSIQLVPNTTHRVHFFDGVSEAQPERVTAIHNHDKGFSSKIVFGRLQNIYVRLVDDPEGPLALFKGIHISPTEVRMVKTQRRVSIEHQARLTYGVGDMYDLKATTFHIAAITEPAITLVNVWPEEKRISEAAIEHTMEEGSFIRAALSNEQLEALWARIDALMTLARF